MQAYLLQKKNLENQDWKAYGMEGDYVFFRKDGINGISVSVGKSTGVATVHAGCPRDYLIKYSPVILEV